MSLEKKILLSALEAGSRCFVKIINQHCSLILFTIKVNLIFKDIITYI